MRLDNVFLAQPLNRMPPRFRFINRVLARLRVRARVTTPPYRWGMANVESRVNLFHLASQTCAYGTPGDLVEIGCNAGESSVVLQRVVSAYPESGKRLHVYDSFEGLPELTATDAADGIYRKGAMTAPLARFEANFHRAGLETRPEIHKGWFNDTIPAQLPERISFAMIDCDLYASTAHVLPQVYARMSPGAIGMFGVYYDPAVYACDGIPGTYASPGAKRAADEFFADKPERVNVLYANEYSNGYFRKL